MALSHFYLAVVVTLVACVSAQCPGASVPPCPYDLTYTAATLTTSTAQNVPGQLQPYTAGANALSFKFSPKLPGRYEFTFSANDICTTKNVTAFVEARCPPQPSPQATLSASQIPRRGQVVIQSVGSTVATNFVGSLTYTWTSISAPTGAPAIFNANSVFTGSYVSQTGTGPSVLTLTNILTPGTYVINLAVSDGCSSASINVCFQVTCNCKPSASASATSTIWSNVGTTTNNSPSGSFTLNAGMSTDFDLLYDAANEKLTYSWSFLEWVPAPALKFPNANANKPPVTNRNPPLWRDPGYLGGNNIPATTLSDGYVTSLTQSSTSTAVTKVWRFQRTPQLQPAYWQNSTSNQALTPDNGSPVVTKNWIPATTGNPSPWFNASEPSQPDEPVTTSMAAMVMMTSVTVTTKTQWDEVHIRTTPGTGATITYCEITINQQDNGAIAYANNPVATLSLTGGSTYEQCRGLWTFRLTVQDWCGSATEATDDFRLTVRCNRPPVAVVGCNDSVIWRSTSVKWDQVILDGRASMDSDNSVLTYSWLFMSAPSGFTCTHSACAETYCNDPTMYTGISFPPAPQTAAAPGTFSQSFGNGNIGGTTVGTNGGSCCVNGVCGPTVFPAMVKPSTSSISASSPGNCRQWVAPPSTIPVSTGNQDCAYDWVQPTQYHVGNSAYFRPSVPGTYRVQLSVFDGCSTVTSQASVVAYCPKIELSIVANMTIGTKEPSTPSVNPVVSYTTTLTYTEVAGVPLTYQWALANATGSFTFSAATSLVSTFSPTSAPATYWVQLSVSDGCQTAIAYAVPFRYNCNAAPSVPSVTGYINAGTGGTQINVGSSVPIETAGAQYPQITLKAASTDATNDPITYTWQFDVNFNNYQSPTYANGNSEVTFRPIWNNGGIGSGSSRSNFQVRLTVTASDGCSNSQASSVSYTFTCSNTVVSRVGASVTAMSYVFNGNTGSFPDIVFNGVASTTPYATVTGWTWSGQYQLFNSQVLNGLTLTGTTSGTGTIGNLTFTPTILASFTIKLTLTDNCASSTGQQVVTTNCPSLPTAAVAVASQTIEWDSTKTPFQGGFPVVSVSGTGSTAATAPSGQTNTQSISYAWSASAASGNLASSLNIVLTNNNQETASFTPPQAGLYEFQLVVSNGPCASTNSGNKATIQARCLRIVAAVASPPSFVLWDGTRFPTVPLDGMASTYTLNTSPASANFYALKYTWTFTDAPSTSMFKKQGPVVNTPVTTTVPQAAAYSPVTTTNPTTGTVVYNETIRYEVRVATTTITYVTTLFNHHYNKPSTCFKPDVAGTYTVQLLIADGCSTGATVSSHTTQVSVGVRCNNPVSPTIVMSGSNQILATMDGITYTRVDLDARATTPSSANDVLTYQWYLLTKPAGSTLTNSSITNAMGNFASIVPDIAGNYGITLWVNDGCNAAVSRGVTVVLTCTESMNLIAPAVYVNGASTAFAATTQEPTASINFATGGFTGNFLVVGSATDNCQVLGRSWRFVARTCASPFFPVAVTPAPTPAPAAATCPTPTRTCEWSIVAWPCDTTGFVRPTECQSGSGTSLPCVLTNTPNTATSCTAAFTPKSPGLYQLMLKVSSACSSSMSYMNVTAQCGSRANAVAGALQTTDWKCQTGGAYSFDTVTFNGASSSVVANSVVPIASCPVPATPAPVAVTQLNVGQCCPPPSRCATCPMCPKCPDCPPPSAPFSTTINTAGAASRSSARRVSLEAEVEEVETLAMVGVVGPLSVLMVLLLAGNVAQHKYWQRRSEEEMWK